MTRHREWPNNCREARDASAELAMKGQRILRTLLEEVPMTDTERTRRIAISLDCFQQIALKLKAVGAEIQP